MLSEIRAYVAEGLAGLAREGVETAGVLFGSRRSGSRITVRTMRPVPCVHRQGPAFILGPEDQDEFAATLSSYLSDRALSGMQPVGWFLVHARDSLVLRPSDQELFERHFPEGWQIALVTRPGPVGSLRAATIARGAEGLEVVNEFSLKQVGNALPADLPLIPPPVRPEREGRLLLPRDRHPEADGHAATVQPPALPPAAPPSLIPVVVDVPAAAPRERRSRFPLLRAAAVAVAACALGAAGIGVYLRVHASTTIGLIAYPRDGVLRIEWDASSRPVSGAISARLQVMDGDSLSLRILNKGDLKRGMWAALCKQADCTATLSVYDSSGRPTEEMVRFIGHPAAPPKSESADEADRRVQELEQEKTHLRGQLNQERHRAGDLESHLKVLQRIVKSRDGH